MSTERELGDDSSVSQQGLSAALYSQRQAVTHQLTVGPCLCVTFVDFVSFCSLILKVYSFYSSCFFCVIMGSVRSKSAKWKRVVSLDAKFRVTRVFDFPKFHRSVLSQVIGYCTVIVLDGFY